MKRELREIQLVLDDIVFSLSEMSMKVGVTHQKRILEIALRVEGALAGISEFLESVVN